MTEGGRIELQFQIAVRINPSFDFDLSFDDVLGGSLVAVTAAAAESGAKDQAGAAGAIAAINGLNVVFGPLFVMLYRWIGWGPFVLNAVILLGLLVYALRQAALRKISDADPQEEATLASLERSDEGS